MEEEKGPPSTPPSPGSRWNPTREQIAILEGIYRQGIRTPSAEQIQRITGRLREFGSIEGKNVFYWFQNHKARQRQKQKQESFAYFSRQLLHRPPPPLLSPPPPPPPPQHRHPHPCTNVVCSPFLLPVPQAGGDGLYQPQLHSVFLPGAVRWRPRAELQRMETGAERALEADHNVPSRPGYYYDPVLGDGGGDAGGAGDETLQLFPLHPTGILDDARPGSSLTWVSAAADGDEDGEEGEGGEDPPFFNFLG